MKKPKMKKGVMILLIIVTSVLFVLLSYFLIVKIIENKKEKQMELLKTQVEEIVENIGISETVESKEYIIKNNKFEGDLFGTNLPKEGTIRVNEAHQVSLALSDGTYCALKGYKDKDILIKESQICSLLIYKDNILNGAEPILEENMIPITFKDGKWYKADLYEKWYDYEEKNWANMVLVKEEVRNAYLSSEEYGEIKENDILAYYVWIPRYEYKLWNIEGTTLEPQTIDIIFEGKDKKSINYENGNYLTHSAFTFGKQEVNGFWVGKFEIAGSEEKVIIKPNVGALTNKKVSVFYNIILAMNSENNIYGLTNVNSHMIKNTEWGAVAYLANSKYGINKEINRSVKTATGGSNYIANINQSTTGNVFGVYDMSGGNYEYVMGYNINGTLDKSGFTELPEEKYYDAYDSNSNINYGKSIAGDAIKETLFWFNTKSYFVTTKTPWFRRGGSYRYGNENGVFAFDDYYGSASPFTGTRAVLVNE